MIKERDYTSKHTPRKECQTLVELSELTSTSTILEPSAGMGNIIKQVHVRRPHLQVTAIDIDPGNVLYLRTLSNVKAEYMDFLDYPVSNKFDRVIANPPFDRDIWMLHLVKMYEHLNDRGILTCITPADTIKEYNSFIYGHIIEVLHFAHENDISIHPMENWVTNKDGSVTPIQVIKWRK